LRLAVGFNPVLSASEAARLAVKSEAAGFESFWIHESLFQRDVVTYLSAISSCTSKLLVASGAINTFTRHPITVATTFASLSELSGGRAILGVGLGSFPTMPLIGQSIFPVSETRPLQRIREYVDLVRTVWSGTRVNFDGEFFKVKDLELGFKVTHRIPIFIASLSPMTQKYAGESADGVILSPSLATVERTEAMVKNVSAGEVSKGRKIERGSYMLASVDADEEKARDVVRGFYFFIYQLSQVVNPDDLTGHGVNEEQIARLRAAWKNGDMAEAKRLVPDAAIDALTITGSEERALDRIHEYVRAGVTLPIIMPIGNVDYALERLSPGASIAV
jgi:5,10-methylenetetrahydromethanopterin reductase